MKSYNIQHDFLFCPKELARSGRPVFDLPDDDIEAASSTPVKLASLLMERDGHSFESLNSHGISIVLDDDAIASPNPVLSNYKELLIRGIIVRCHEKGIKVFRRA